MRCTQPTHFNISFATHARINEIKKGESGDLVFLSKSVKHFCVGGIRLANLCPIVAKWSLRILGIY